MRYRSDYTRHRKPIHGFTLIELLVVISIIALLLSVLLPSLSRAKKMAQATICQAGLKQWGAIWLMYLDENNGSFPEGTIQGVNVAPRGQWIVALESYREQDIKSCPSAKKDKIETQREGSVDSVWTWGGVNNDPTHPGIIDEGSYGLNAWLYNPPSSFKTIQGRSTSFNWRKMTNISGTDNVPLFFDSSWPGAGPKHIDTPVETKDTFVPWNDTQEMRHTCFDRHLGHVNSAMMDFSVRKIGLKELWRLKWHKKFDVGANFNDGRWPEWMKSLKDY